MATYFYDTIRAPINKLVVIFDYNSPQSEDLKAKAGDEVQVIKRFGHWVEAEGSDGSRGLIPEAFLKEPDSLEAMPWFFPTVARIEAHNLLVKQSPGTYLIRNSSTEKQYALSLRTANPEKPVLHYKICYFKDKGFYIHLNISHFSLRKLISFYQNDAENLLNLPHRLEKICPKSIPRIYQLTPKNQAIDHSEIQMGANIGEGNFGKVYKGFYRHFKIAIKELEPAKHEIDRENFKKELSALMELHHENVVTLYGFCAAKDWFIFEYVDHGCLEHQLQNQRFNSNQLLAIALQIVRGMTYIHSMDYIHRDLAARNILITDDNTAKISDFGLSRKLASANSLYRTTSQRTPIQWEALESLTKGVYNKDTDVWMFAALLYEMYTCGERPFKEIEIESDTDQRTKTEKLIEILKQGQRLKKPPGMPAKIYELQKKCMDRNPKKRPKFKKIEKLFIDFD